MDLMDVEGVQLAAAIFDDPVLDVALRDDDVGSCVVRVEQLGVLSCHGQVEVGAAVWIVRIVWFVGEIECAGAGWFYVAQPCVVRARERGGICSQLHVWFWGVWVGHDYGYRGGGIVFACRTRIDCAREQAGG